MAKKKAAADSDMMPANKNPFAAKGKSPKGAMPKKKSKKK